MNRNVRKNEIDVNSKKMLNKKILRNTFLSHKSMSQFLDFN